MSSFSRLYLRKRGAPGDRVWMRCETATPPSPDPDASAGDVCIVKDGASSAVLQYDGSTWSAIAGGSEPTPLGYYDPMAAPASPNARDLEFATTDGLTTWNAGSLAGFSATASDSRLRLTTTSQASSTNILSGAYRDCPTATDWCAWAKISVTGVPGNVGVAPYGGGLFLATADIDANPGTADVLTSSLYLLSGGGSSVLYVQRFSAHNAFLDSPATIDLGAPRSNVWMRVRWANASTRLSIDMSEDGVGWKQIYSTTSPYVTPARIGLHSISANSASDPSPVVSADFLRFGTSADMNADTLGNSI